MTYNEYRAIGHAINSHDLPLIKEWLKKATSELITVETDNERYEAIMRGKWPNSISFLEEALKKAKQYKKLHPDVDDPQDFE